MVSGKFNSKKDKVVDDKIECEKVKFWQMIMQYIQKQNDFSAVCPCNGQNKYFFPSIKNVDPFHEDIRAQCPFTSLITAFAVCISNGTCYSTNNAKSAIITFNLVPVCINGGGFDL